MLHFMVTGHRTMSVHTMTFEFLLPIVKNEYARCVAYVPEEIWSRGLKLFVITCIKLGDGAYEKLEATNVATH